MNGPGRTAIVEGFQRAVSSAPRTVIFALATLAGCAGSGEVRHEPAAVHGFVPLVSLTGARVAAGADATGSPLMALRALAFQRFVYPVSVAGRNPDTYIADAGSGTLFHFDGRFDAMTALSGVQVRNDTRLDTGRDGSLYVVDPVGRRVLRFARGGRLLATFRDEVNLIRPVDVAADEARARVLVADGALGHLVAFHPLGRVAGVMPLRRDAGTEIFGVAAIAISAESLYVSDPICRCVARLSPEGLLLDIFGRGELGQPGPLAVDRFERVYVVDRADGSLRVFAQGRSILHIRAEELKLQDISDVRIQDDLITLADSRGARVEIMRIALPDGPR